MATSRETVRDELVVLLDAVLTGAGNPCETVTGSKPTTLVGVTPLVAVLNAGANRVPFTFQGNKSYFDFVIQSWVLMADPNATPPWTLARAEVALDDIEAIIAGVFEASVNTTYWTEINYKGVSRVVQWAVNSVPYYVELTPIRAMLARS